MKTDERVDIKAVMSFNSETQLNLNLLGVKFQISQEIVKEHQTEARKFE